MHVFYTPDIQTHAELPEEEAAHAVRVLRLQAGDEVMLTDGKGCFYRAEISTATNKRCLVNILETLQRLLMDSGFVGFFYGRRLEESDYDRSCVPVVISGYREKV